MWCNCTCKSFILSLNVCRHVFCSVGPWRTTPAGTGALHCFPSSFSNQSASQRRAFLWSGELRAFCYDSSTSPSDALPGISTADSWRVLPRNFIWLLPHGALGLHRSVAMDVRQTCAGMKKDLPWSPAQRAAYLCIVRTACRNLTTGERKHAILRDLLTDREQEGRGRKKVMW